MRNIFLFSFFILPITIYSQNVVFEKAYGGSSDEYVYDLQQTTAGGFIIGGYTYSNDGDINQTTKTESIWVVKVNSIGEIQWEKKFGGSKYDELRTILQTSDGGYIFGGSTNSIDGDVKSGNLGGVDMWVVKLNSSGEIEWEKTYGGFNDDYIISLQETPSGGFIIGGNTYSGGNGSCDISVREINSTGETIWRKIYGGRSMDVLTSLQITTDGGYLFGGYTYSTDGDIKSGTKGGFDMWLVRLDSKGLILWEKTIGGTKDDRIWSVKTTNDGGCVVGGETSSNDGDIKSGNKGGFDMWFLKIDSLGYIQWEKTYGGTNYDRINSIICTPIGEYILGGVTSSRDGDVQSGNKGGSDIWVLKINSNSVIQWEKTYGGTSGDDLECIRETIDKCIIIGGCVSSNDGDIKSGFKGGKDFWLLKINDTSTLLDEIKTPKFNYYTTPTSIIIKQLNHRIDSKLKINIYNLNGQLKYSSINVGEQTEINTEGFHGLYLLQVLENNVQIEGILVINQN